MESGKWYNPVDTKDRLYLKLYNPSLSHMDPIHPDPFCG